MSAIVSFKSDVSGQHHPTSVQRMRAQEAISALYRARREGLLRSYLKSLSTSQHTQPAQVQKSLESLTGNAVTTTKNVENSTRQPSDSINAENFLRLLVMQMQYQDPLNPVENTDMLAQLAQFSVLEQSIQMNEKVERLQNQITDLATNFQVIALNTAQQLIGKTIEGASINGKPVRGTVSSVTLQHGTVLLNIGDDSIPLNQVQRIDGVQSLIPK